MQTLTSLLRPHAFLKRRAWIVLAIAQATALMIAYSVLRPPILPSPSEVLDAVKTLWTSQGLGAELLSSLATSLEATLLAMAIACAIAYASVIPAFRPFASAIGKGRFLGYAGLPFLFTLAFGGGHLLKLALLTFGMAVFMTTAMVAEVEAIPLEKFEHARTLRMSEARVLWEVVIRGTLDRAMEVLRQNAAIGWTMLTLVEGLVRSEGGAGVILLNGDKHLHIADVIGVQLAILTVGLLQDGALAMLGRLVCPHVALVRGRKE